MAGRRIETRLFAKVADATWRHTTYVWNADMVRLLTYPSDIAAGKTVDALDAFTTSP